MRYLVMAFTLIFSMSGSVNADGHFRKVGEYEGTISYREYTLYEVHLSDMPELKWIKTIACVEILVYDEVQIDVWGDTNGETVGGFFYIIDDYEPRDEWDQCQITGFYSSKP